MTFDPSGHASDVSIDQPGDWPPGVVACVSARLATARVREFDGPPVAFGAWLFIRFD